MSDEIEDLGIGGLTHFLQTGRIDRSTYLRAAAALGVSEDDAGARADAALAILENQRRLRSALSETYDYVVVGVGTAGSVLAARLSEDPDVSVLALEAGGVDAHALVLEPTAWGQLFEGEIAWEYQTVPQEHAAGRPVHCPRGKMLGGCGSHNASAWVWCHPRDYDAWGYAGNHGWDHRAAWEVFRRAEDYSGGASDLRGAGGPMPAVQLEDRNPLSRAFVEGAQGLGLPYLASCNGTELDGVTYFDLNVQDGERFGVARAFLHPAMARPNLTVVTGAHARRLTFEGTRCTGIEVELEGATRTFRANRETVVSCGAIDTPKLLLLSGVGSGAELGPLGIDVVADLPGVGRGLQDHILLAGINYECAVELPPPVGNAAEATLWMRSREGLPFPDIQHVMIEGPFVTPELADRVPENAYAIAPGLIRPASRGSVTLVSADPADDPAIDMNYLGREVDLEALLVAVEFCRELGASSAFDDYRKREILPGPVGRSEMIEFVRMSTTTYFHPTSSCPMGIGDGAVVDPELRVYGIEGLRIADASIMPEIPSGNTNAPSLFIGEQAARFLRS